MKLNMRPYQTVEDYWRLRDLLRQAMILNSRREFSWHVARLDYWWGFVNADLEKRDPAENVFLWETEDGQLAGALTPEGQGNAFLQIRPDFSSDDLAEEMICVAEERLFTITNEGQKKVWVHSDSKDTARHEVLIKRGFSKVAREGGTEYQHRRNLEEPLPEIPQVPGYTFRPMGAGLELLERCYASGLGFHEDDINTARENRDDPSWYHNIQNTPLYRRDLDIVAVAHDGSIASFATMWFDDVSRTAYIEPVATVPVHQRRGLGKATILTGLHLLKKMGCKVAFVGGSSEAANRLYYSVMGPEVDLNEPWEKTID